MFREDPSGHRKSTAAKHSRKSRRVSGWASLLGLSLTLLVHAQTGVPEGVNVNMPPFPNLGPNLLLQQPSLLTLCKQESLMDSITKRYLEEDLEDEDEDDEKEDGIKCSDFDPLKTCDEPEGELISAISCEAMKSDDERAASDVRKNRSHLCHAKCKRNQASFVEERTSCLERESAKLVERANTQLQQEFAEYQRLVTESLRQINEELNQRRSIFGEAVRLLTGQSPGNSDISSARSLLEEQSGTGAGGLFGLRQEMQAFRRLMTQQNENMRAQVSNLAQQAKTLNELREITAAQTAYRCFNEDLRLRCVSEDFFVDHNGRRVPSQVSLKDYILCRYNQQKHVVDGKINYSEPVKAEARTRTQLLEAKIDALLAQLPVGTDPNSQVANNIRTFDRFLAELNNEIGSGFSDVEGFNVFSQISGKMRRCFDKGRTLANADMRSTSKPLGQQRFALQEARQSVLAQAKERIKDFDDKYRATRRELGLQRSNLGELGISAGECFNSDRIVFATTDEGAAAALARAQSCMSKIEEGVDRIVSSRGAPTGTLTLKAKRGDIQIQCSGIGHCIDVLQFIGNREVQVVQQIMEAKGQAIQGANNDASTKVSNMQAQVQNFKNFLEQAAGELNGLGILTGAGVPIPIIETLNPDFATIKDPDGADVIVGLKGPILKVNDRDFARSQREAREKAGKFSSEANKAREYIDRLISDARECRKEVIAGIAGNPWEGTNCSYFAKVCGGMVKTVEEELSQVVDLVASRFNAAIKGGVKGWDGGLCDAANAAAYTQKNQLKADKKGLEDELIVLDDRIRRECAQKPEGADDKKLPEARRKQITDAWERTCNGLRTDQSTLNARIARVSSEIAQVGTGMKELNAKDCRSVAEGLLEDLDVAKGVAEGERDAIEAAGE